jgi:hypothetical protein
MQVVVLVPCQDPKDGLELLICSRKSVIVASFNVGQRALEEDAFYFSLNPNMTLVPAR